MRKEEEVREFYVDYVNRHVEALLDKRVVAANQYFGAAVACGRTLGKDLNRIVQDITVALEFSQKQRQA